LSYFKVENFKRFDSLEVKDIGQFNLVVGDNNVGKTSLLEALLFDDENFTSFLMNLKFFLSVRKLNNLNNDASLIDLFSKNPKKPIRYKFQFINNTLSELVVNLKLKSSLNYEELDKIAMKLKLYQDQYLVEFSLNNKNDFIFFSESNLINVRNNSYFPYIAFTTIYDNDIVEFFSKLAFSSNWLENFKQNLKDFIPTLTSIEVTNAISKTPIIVLREFGIDLARPLSEYGDGVIKLFRYLLELDLCENNRLMIDEIDTGIHYSRMKEFFKKVLQAAKNKNVQIFATTHSKECLVYFTKALEELGYQDNGRVIKIADTKSGIKAYTSRFAEFENSLFNDSEIR